MEKDESGAEKRAGLIESGDTSVKFNLVYFVQTTVLLSFASGVYHARPSVNGVILYFSVT